MAAMHVVLCALSPARQKMLEEEPELLDEVLSSRREVAIPGLLDLGNAWDALDRLVTAGKLEGPLADAVLGRGGRPFGVRGAIGRPRLLDAKRVTEIATALDALPADVVRQRYKLLAGKNVHGDYAKDVPEPDDPAYLKQKVKETTDREIAELEAVFKQLRDTYAKAAAANHAVVVSVA
ncbi:MAG: DUF1877 family protein [Micrococcales bacterium]|nr:DUF1877 family protein [Micrococcales bacterium]